MECVLSAELHAKKLTLTVDERVYRGLHEKIGRGRISRFIEEVVRPHVTDEDLDAAYKQMSKEERREEEALEWIEGLIGDVSSKPR